jgi:hypothetical protein
MSVLVNLINFLPITSIEFIFMALILVMELKRWKAKYGLPKLPKRKEVAHGFGIPIAFLVNRGSDKHI